MAKEILTFTKFYQTFTLKTKTVIEISKSLKSSQLFFFNCYFSLCFFQVSNEIMLVF